MTSLEENLKRNRAAAAGAVLPALLSAFSLGADFQMASGLKESVLPSCPEVLTELAESLSRTGPVLWSLILSCTFMITVWKNLRRTGKPSKLLFCVSCILSLLMVQGNGFAADNSLGLLYASKGQLIKTFFFWAGYANLIECAGYGLDFAMGTGPGTGLPERHVRSLIPAGTAKQSVPVTAVLLMLLWLPHLIIACPAYVCPDSWYILSQYFGLSTFTAHHPPVYTILVGAAADFSGRVFGGNGGLFFVILLQYMLMAFILAYVFHIISGMRPPAWILWPVILAAVFSPYYTNYSVVILKDVPYSCFFLLWLTEMIMILRGRFTAGRMCRFWLSAVFIICLRKNGIYVVIPSLLALILYYVRRAEDISLPERITGRRSDSRAKRLRICAFGCLLMLAVAVPSHLTEAVCCKIWNIQEGSIREALSLPFQQTARFVCRYGDEVTAEERTAIDRVLVYDELAGLYNPRLADPVKGTFRSECTRADLVRYVRTWAAQGIRHPAVYFEATANQNYLLILPGAEEGHVFTKTFQAAQGNEHAAGVFEKTGVHDTWTGPFKSYMEAWYKLCFRLPGIGLLSDPAVYTITLLLASVICIYRKRLIWLTAAVPLFLSLLIVVAGPVVQGNARYLLPVIYSLPLLLAWLAELCRNERTGTA